MKRDAFTMPLDLGHELIIDNFAGGGGTSTGLEAAFGRPVDIAINHDPEALAMHALNHPHTHHLCESVWDVDPIAVTKNRPVALVWLSPDCKHFSKAKGGTPVAKHIRGLAWVGMRWVAKCKPRALLLENVEEFTTWGPLISFKVLTTNELGEQVEEIKWKPDPAKKGKTFNSFVAQLRAHGYNVDWRLLRASDNGAPTIRKRLFLVARRDGLPIIWPEATHGDPGSAEVLSGKLAPWRTAADCIDFSHPAASIFDRDRPLADNTMRRVAKGLFRHVLASEKPFFVGASDSASDEFQVSPFISEHANASNQRNMAANEPMRTICSQVKGGHFSVVTPQFAPLVITNTTGHAGASLNHPLATATTGNHHALTAAALAPLRGSTVSQMGGHAVRYPLSTVAAGGTHHALLGASLVTIGYGERQGQDARVQSVRQPLGTAVAGGAKQAVVAAHLVDMGHGEGPAGGKRFSHGVRSLGKPLNTVTASGATSGLSAIHLTHLTHHGERSGRSLAEPLATVTGAHRGEQAVVSACLEQAYGGFYDGDGRSLSAPLSTITSKGAQQRLISAYCVRPTGEMLDEGVTVKKTGKRKKCSAETRVVRLPADCLHPKLLRRARKCAKLLRKYLPDEFPQAADIVLLGDLVVVDVTLRMLKPRELFRAQAFPDSYRIEEIPDPALLFKDGVQAADPLTVPRIPLSATAQVRMCGNSVSPVQAQALIEANFAHEALIYRKAA